MSDFIIEITNENNNTIEIETSFIGNENTVVEVSSSEIIEINNADKLLASDFPDFYHTKIIDFNTAVSGLLPSGQSVSVTDVQNIIGLSGIIAGTGIDVSYNDSTGYTTINTSGFFLGSSTFYLGTNGYSEINGLSMISGLSIASPTTLIHCIIDGGTP
jgi:hypothetical protein